MRGREVEVEATNIAHGGFGVARLDGRVVFVAEAIPGERVRARISDDRKARFWWADTVEVLESSPHRRPHLWPEADVSRDPAIRPGGADFGHIDPAHQRAHVASVGIEADQRAVVDVVDPLAAPDSLPQLLLGELLHLPVQRGNNFEAALVQQVIAVLVA